jgi:diguanylate cyclase (GGDEF)-like protein
MPPGSRGNRGGQLARPRGLLLGLVLAALAWPAAAAQDFDLAAYRQLAASDRTRGIREGREALAAGVFAEEPRQRMLLLWYMGGAAIGAPDELALREVIQHLEALQTEGQAGAGSLAGFLRGARLIDLGDTGEGLVQALTAANALPDDDDELRRIGASELCRTYAMAGEPTRGAPHCQRHTRLVQATGDAVALARAHYLEASVLSLSGNLEAAIPLWRQAREGFADAGLPALAGRAAGGLAVDLIALDDYAGALDMAREAVVAATEAGNAISISIAERQEAEALLGVGRVDEAGEVVQRALARMEGLDHPPTLRDLLQVQRTILVAQDATPDQLAELDARLAVFDTEAPEPEHTGVIDELERRYVQREQALRIRELEQENLRKELEIESARQRAIEHERKAREQRLMSLLWGVATVALVLLLGAAAWILRAQRRLAASLRDQAYRDGLTRLPNRRALLEHVQDLLMRQPEGPHALLMVDIDHFKHINDSRGHLVGDRVLARVAACLAASEPEGGLVARLGGEEFVVLAPNLPRESAVALAEQLRVAVAALELATGDETPFQVTASLGVAFFPAPGISDHTAWLGAADAALYSAKREGRNRVVVAE